MRTAVALLLAAVGCSNPAPAGESPPAPPPAPSAPWPTPPPYDLTADLDVRTALAGGHVTYTKVQDDVFLLASDKQAVLDDIAPRLHASLAALLDGRFSRAPSRALTLYVFDDTHSFFEVCRERVSWDACDRLLGLWKKETRELFVDLSSGKTTLTHELVHTLLDADAEAVPGGPGAWAAPHWLHEGIAALFETPVVTGTTIHGVTNWRLADLRAAQGSRDLRDLVHLDALFRMPDELFDGPHPGAAYAVARFACQWMDSPEQDRLWKFYRRWRAHSADDATGEASFQEVFGQTPKEADRAWQVYLGSLHKPR